MPWTFDQSQQKELNERLKKAIVIKPETVSQLTDQQKILLSDYPALSAWLQKQTVKQDAPLQELPFTTELPKHTDAATKFYSIVVSNECRRLYNNFIEGTKSKTNKVDLIYHTNVLLKKIKVLLLQTIELMQDREVDDTTTIPNSLSAFVLHYLKRELVAFYFSIQEVHKTSLDETIDPENFFLLELHETTDKVIPLTQTHKIERQPVSHSTTDEVFTFGFHGDAKKLKTVIIELCREIELLDESRSQVDDLMKVITAKNIKPGSTKIYIGCQTKQFRHVLDLLDKKCNHLSLANVEKSQFFYSKQNKLIKENNLSASASKGRITVQKQSTIDNIFKHLQ